MSWHDLNHCAKQLIRSYLDGKSDDTMNTCSWCDDPVSMGVLLGQPCLKHFVSWICKRKWEDFCWCNQHGNLPWYQSPHMYVCIYKYISIITYVNTGEYVSIEICMYIFLYKYIHTYLVYVDWCGLMWTDVDWCRYLCFQPDFTLRLADFWEKKDPWPPVAPVERRRVDRSRFRIPKWWEREATMLQSMRSFLPRSGSRKETIPRKP